MSEDLRPFVCTFSSSQACTSRPVLVVVWPKRLTTISWVSRGTLLDAANSFCDRFELCVAIWMLLAFYRRPVRLKTTSILVQAARLLRHIQATEPRLLPTLYRHAPANPLRLREIAGTKPRYRRAFANRLARIDSGGAEHDVKNPERQQCRYPSLRKAPCRCMRIELSDNGN